MKNKKHVLTYLSCAMSSLLAGMPLTAFAESTSLTIDLSKQHYIGANSEIQRNKFFNLHTRPGDPGTAEIDLLYIKNELNAGFGRLFWGPMSVAGSVDYPSTEFAITNGPDNITNIESAWSYPYYSKRVVATEHPRTVMLEGNDPVKGARWAADYFEHYFNDETRPLFYEPMNEPFVHADDFVDGPWDPVANAAVQRQMTRWFDEIGREFDARGLETQVVGFSSAWPSFELNDFGHWESRQKMFMDNAGDNMDAFSFHLYDGVNVTGQDNIRSGSNADAIIDIIETYSHIKWGEVRPHALTEYGGIVQGFPDEYSPEKSSQELRSYNHILFSLLEREDRLLTSVPFITGAAQWYYQANNFNPYSATVFRPDPDKIIAGKVNGLLPTEKAKFFLLWSDVKGKRIVVDETDPDLVVQAFNYGDTVYLALNNFEDGEKVVNLDFIASSNVLESVRIKRLVVPENLAAIYTDETEDIAPTSLTMAAHETAVLAFKYSDNISQDEVVRTSSYYSDTYLQAIVADSTVQFNFTDVLTEQNSLSFADAMAATIPFDQSAVDAIASPNIKRYAAIMKSYDRSFARILAKYPDNWESSSDFQRLAARVERSNAAKEALQYHYSQHGYNDSDGIAMIKMGIARKHDKSKQPKLVFNGHTIGVPNDWKGYDQAPRDDFFGTIEVPVPAKFVKHNHNTVDITFSDTQGQVSSVILEVDVPEPIQHVAVDAVEMEKTYLSINKDKPFRLNATALPAAATNKFLLWSSSDASVAMVNNDGIVTPVSPGDVSITATSYDGGHSGVTELTIRDQLTVRNTVVVTTDISEIDPTNALTLDLDYSTDIPRDVTFELRSPTNEWMGLARATVAEGDGTVQITLNFAEDLPSGNNYRLIAALRSVGGDWRTGVDSHVFNFNVRSPYTPPEPEEGNLFVDNGGFERGDLGDWTLTYGSTGLAKVKEEAARTGRFGVEFDATDGAIGIVMDQTVLPIDIMQPDKLYKLSFWLKRTTPSDQTSGPWAGGFTQFVNNTDGFKTSGQQWYGGTNVGEWFLVEKEFTGQDWPEVGTFIEINLRTAGNTWYADDFKLEDITPEPQAPENLLGENADFEYGNLDNWQMVFGSTGTIDVIADAAKDGNYGARLDTTDGRIGIFVDHTILPDDVMQAGKTYRLSFDMRRVSGTGWAGGFTHFTNNTGEYVRSPQGPWHGTTSVGEWIAVEKIIEGIVDWPESGTFIELNMVTQGDGHVWDIDNVVLNDISEIDE